LTERGTRLECIFSERQSHTVHSPPGSLFLVCIISSPLTPSLSSSLKGQTRDPNTLRAQYLESYLGYRDFKFGTQLCMGNADRAHK